MKRKVKQGVARMTQSGPHEVTAGNHRVAAETDLAAEVKRLLASDRPDEAAERFGAIIDRQQRRAARIAYHYLRDPAEVDEVVQDAFLKAFLHLPSFRDDLYFELWFTRILVNACLDRLKAKERRARWLVPSDARDNAVADGLPSREPSPEAALLAKERRAHLEAAIDQLPTRQRTAVILRHLEGRYGTGSEHRHGTDRVDGTSASVSGSTEATESARQGRLVVTRADRTQSHLAAWSAIRVRAVGRSGARATIDECRLV